MRNWDEAANAMKRVPVWYRVHIVVYVIFLALTTLLLGIGIGWAIWANHG